ncbi:MAG: hypothetical protein J3Q66DRAFT_405965 [Benniella sp.]|nr:MAG: hypothetical protein J3Q66DRAFT_405965 [Benniella sp.]
MLVYQESPHNPSGSIKEGGTDDNRTIKEVGDRDGSKSKRLIHPMHGKISQKLVFIPTMTSIFKSIVSLALTLSALQVACARPQGPGPMGAFSPDSGSGFGGNPSAAFNGFTHVPVGPVQIAAETDFLPISNVWPIVNVFPTDVSDFSGMGPFDWPLPGGNIGNDIFGMGSGGSGGPGGPGLLGNGGPGPFGF